MFDYPCAGVAEEDVSASCGKAAGAAKRHNMDLESAGKLGGMEFTLIARCTQIVCMRWPVQALSLISMCTLLQALCLQAVGLCLLTLISLHLPHTQSVTHRMWLQSEDGTWEPSWKQGTIAAVVIASVLVSDITRP